MAVNKVIINGITKIDLTGDTIQATKLVSGYTAHDKTGNAVEGTLEIRTVYTGTGAPSDTLGTDGDLYIDMG